MVPWWVIVVVLCILLSGYMALRTWKIEKKIELEGIEREGQVYMERIERERERRRKLRR